MKKLIIYYFFFLLSVFLILSSGVIDSQDGFQYLAVARNIYYRGEPTAPPYEYDTRKNVYMSLIIGKNGKPYSLTGLGYSLAYLPAVFVTDIVYKYYGIAPPLHFPLENDWLIFLTASLTNAFFGAMLGAILLIYFVVLGLTKKQALLMSLVSIFVTNLLVYTKHSMPHMMFVVFMMTSFLLVKLYSSNKNRKLLTLCGASFGILSITYNPTFVLTLLPLILYYFLLTRLRISKTYLQSTFKDILYVVIGLAPFALIYIWFENLRAASNTNFIATSYYSTYASHLYRFPFPVFIEGLYGQLFSPGRSFFLYSPILLIIIFFWHKIKKVVFPEVLVFITASITFIIFYAMQYSPGSIEQGMVALWHGENSWGPRYLTPLIPLGMLIVGVLYKDLSKKIRYVIFYPLVFLGLYVSILGVLMPYQIKLNDLEEKFFLNGTEYKSAVYSNFLPRYSPIIMMSKKLVKLVQTFPKTFDHGLYNVRFYDGIDFPFNVGPERWRVIEGRGYISFDDNKKNPIKELTFGVINHPISESSSSAELQFLLNNKPVSEKYYEIEVTKRELIKLNIPENILKAKDNRLVVQVDYNTPMVTKLNKQILGLQSFDINGQRVNMESIDVPYVSALGPKLTGVSYQNWGGINKDPWKMWNIHTQTFERLPDFWWIRNMYYWDLPKAPLLLLLTGTILVFIYAGFKMLALLRS